jgi:hypothetical protein
MGIPNSRDRLSGPCALALYVGQRSELRASVVSRKYADKLSFSACLAENPEKNAYRLRRLFLCPLSI